MSTRKRPRYPHVARQTHRQSRVQSDRADTESEKIKMKTKKLICSICGAVAVFVVIFLISALAGALFAALIIGLCDLFGKEMIYFCGILVVVVIVAVLAVKIYRSTP